MKFSRTLASFFAALIVFLTVGAAFAWAHAVLLRAVPAPDSVLSEQPTAVRLWFNEPVEIGADAIVVIDPRGRRVEEAASVSATDATLLEATVHGSEPGSYKVRWTVLSDDGHPVSGTYVYSVGRTTAPGEIGTAPSHTVLLASARLVHLVGLALAVGALALLALGGAATPPAHRLLSAMGLAGAVALVVAAPLGLFAQTVALGGSAPDTPLLASLGPTLSSHWGRWWIVRAAGSLGLLAVFALFGRDAAPRRSLQIAALPSAFLLLLGTSANGHAMTTSPAWLSVSLDMVHLSATGAWLGGLFGMLLLVRASRGGAAVSGGLVVDLTSLVPRFSTLAFVCVQALILTGLYQTWAHVSRPALLSTTSYGQTLLVKLGLLALVAAPAGINRFVLKPRLTRTRVEASDPAGLVGRFARVLSVEAGLGVLVLAAAALLSTLPPAEELPSAATATTPVAGASPADAAPSTSSAAAPARVWSATRGDRTVVLSLDPALTGSNQARLSLRDASGRPVDGGALRLRAVAPPGSGAANAVVQLGRAGLEYECLLTLPTAGEWTLEVLLGETDSVSFRVDVVASLDEHASHPPDGAAP